MDSKYLMVGSSHAALEAAAAIRIIDYRGTLTLLTRDAHLPYSPTILPYVVSGRSQPDNVQLRDAAYFRANAIDFVSGAEVVSLDPTQSMLGSRPASIGSSSACSSPQALHPACRRSPACLMYHSTCCAARRCGWTAASDAVRQVGAGARRRPDRHARGREHGQGRHRSHGGGVAAVRAVELFRA